MSIGQSIGSSLGRAIGPSLAGGGWSPLSLFQSGESGLVYDAMDLSGFYSDAALTTQCVVNATCGSRRDSSKGSELGPDLADTIGSSDAWAAFGTNLIADDDGAVRITYVDDSKGGYAYFRESAGLNSNLTVGKWYRVSYRAKVNGGSVTPAVDVGSLVNGLPVANTEFAEFSITFVATNATTNNLRIESMGASEIAWIEGISICEIPGNHAYQSTAANRPILRGTPTGSNLVSNGGFDSGSNWTPGAGWAIGAGVATATASSAALTSTLAATSGRVYLVRYTMTRSAGTLTPSFGGVTLTARSAGGTYEEFVTASSTAALVFTGAAFSGTVDDASVIDYSADVVTAPYALQMGTVAGVDRWMQTAAVDFSATDELTVCWGVRKHSDAAQGVVAELTASVIANDGAFAILAPASAAGNYGFSLRASVGYTQYRATTFTSPTAAVVECQYNASGALLANEVFPRVNGAIPTLANVGGASGGTGNFANAALYFGKRGGASLPFLGLDYGGVIRGALTTTELTSLERWVSARTPGTTIA